MKRFFGKCCIENKNIMLEFYILNFYDKYGIEIFNKGKIKAVSSVFNITDDENLINKIAAKLFNSKTLPENLIEEVSYFI